VGPVPKDHVNRDGPQMLEEAIRRSTCDDRGSPGEHAKVSCSVKGEGEQIEDDQDAGEGFLAVSKIMALIASFGNSPGR
jgi:hypothetical protein